MFSDPSHMFSASYSRHNSTIHHDRCRKIISTMATCHSLRVVDGELLGDPLDIKMFNFTGWIYEEGGSANNSDQSNIKGDTIIPSVAKPPQNGYTSSNDQVRSRTCLIGISIFTERILNKYSRFAQNSEFYGLSNLHLIFVVPALL
jgi:hypothetical protein